MTPVINPMLDRYIVENGELKAHIAELEAENKRITDAYKVLITKLNEEEQDNVNITP